MRNIWDFNCDQQPHLLAAKLTESEHAKTFAKNRLMLRKLAENERVLIYTLT